MDYKKIGQNIKKYRIEKGFTQNTLAKKIGKSESSIRKYEKGLVEIPNTVLENIARVLTISPSLLMPESDLVKQIIDISTEKGPFTPEYGLEHLVKGITDSVMSEYIKKIQTDYENQSTDDPNSIEVKDLKRKAHSIPKEALKVLRQAQAGIIESAALTVSQGRELLDSINKLNEEGQQKVKEYADDLAENPRYQRADAPDPEE